MKKRGWGAAAAALLFTATLAGPAAGATRKLEPLNQYTVSGASAEQLAQLGYDATEGAGTVVATPSQADALRAKGFKLKSLGKEATALQAAPPDPFADPTHGYNVFRPW